MSGSDAKTILIIDDDHSVRSVVEKFLKREGYRVVATSDASVGLELVDTLSPHLVVLDMRMKGLSGAGFLNRITDSDGRLGTAVLVLTGFSAMESLFQDVEVDGFMTKPIDYDELKDEVSRILEAREEAAKQPSTVARHRRFKVLVGEDDIATGRELMREFEKVGYRVDLVTSSSDTVGRAITLSPDIVVAKAVMEGMDGADIASTLSSIPKTSSMPVVLYTIFEGAEPDLAGHGRFNAGGTNRIIIANKPSQVVTEVQMAMNASGK